jgi:thiol-disulfide isomerase/thioredoxin
MIMKRRLNVIVALTLSVILAAATSQGRTAEPRESALESLLSKQPDEKALNAAIAKATEAGVPAAAITEAKLRFYLTNKNYKELYRLRNEFQAMLDKWESKASNWKTKEDAETLVAYATAKGANAEHDEELFHRSILRAFWLSPTYADSFGRLVIDHKRDERAKALVEKASSAAKGDDPARFEAAVKEAFWAAPEDGEDLGKLVTGFQKRQTLLSLVIPLQTELLAADGSKVTLKNLIGKRQALYLDFWASWCAPCIARMKTLESRGRALKNSNVVVAGVNTEHDISIAEKMQKQKHMTVAWLVEPESQPLHKIFEIDSIPKVWIITKDGKLLYEGHPDDDELADLLKEKYQVTLPPSENED